MYKSIFPFYVDVHDNELNDGSPEDDEPELEVAVMGVEANGADNGKCFQIMVKFSAI